jgi:hypothetical protein
LSGWVTRKADSMRRAVKRGGACDWECVGAQKSEKALWMNLIWDKL